MTQRCGAIIACMLVLLSSALEAASPTLSTILPRGAQRGTEAVLTFSGARLEDAEEILFYEPGVEVTKIEAKNANQIEVTLKIAADCALGEKTVQVRCKSGISDYRTFFVGALPEVAEKEPNSDFASPQEITLNQCINGIVTNEDVDYYVVEAKKGQRISAEVEGMRLGTTLFDPYVAILNEARFELSAADDSPLLKQDAVAAIIAPEDGRYIIEVRESAYGGNGSSHYRLHVGTFPRPLAIYPAGGKIGADTEVRLIGDPAGDSTMTVKAPAEIREEWGIYASDESGLAPSANVFRLSEHDNVLEVEPNDAVAQATPGELPNTFNGIIQNEGDIDFFKFTAKKGQVFEVECFARRVRSPLDPVVNVYKVGGGSVAGNDDSRGPDSYFRLTVPEDGEYAVRVTDHLSRGGPEFVYRIEFLPVKPSLTLGIPRVARYSQDRQRIVVPRGNRFATLISANRANFGGELVLDGSQLPAGITMHAENMAANLNSMPVVFEAAADAPIGGALIDFRARHVDENTGISGPFTNRADFVIGSPGQSLYVWKDVDRLPVAVVEEVPFHLEIIEPKVPLVRDGSLNLRIVAHKKEGWDEQINVQFPFRPPGVGATSSVNIPKGQTECLYPLSANGSAQIKEWKVYALGQANVNGAAWVSSQLATLTVAEPYVGIELVKADVEQGQETELVAKVSKLRDFPGKATVELLGLPARTTTEVKEIDMTTEELVFKIKTEEQSPAGTHKNIFCRVTITENDEPIVHARVGVTELRIDKPLPPKVAAPDPKPAPMPVAKAPEPEKKPEKRLSRLEKLRLEAQQRTEGGGSE